jgi:hypothetical protein
MAVSFIASISANTGTASALTVSGTVPGTVAVGDVALLVCSGERDLVPSISFPTAGYTSVEAATNATSNTSQKGWKRIAAGDLGGTISGTVTTSRRMGLAVVFYRGANDPVFTHSGLVINDTADVTAEHPNISPLANDAFLVSMMASNNNVSPFQRTYTSAAGWTERVEASSQSTTANNATAYVADKLLVGQSGVAQTGNVVTDASGTKFTYYASTASLTPQGTVLPAGWDEVRLFTRT